MCVASVGMTRFVSRRRSGVNVGLAGRWLGPLFPPPVGPASTQLFRAQGLLWRGVVSEQTDAFKMRVGTRFRVPEKNPLLSLKKKWSIQKKEWGKKVCPPLKRIYRII